MQRAQVPTLNSMEEAGGALLERAINPARWALPGRRVTVDNTCRVGSVQVCASVDVTPTLETFLRVSFRGPKLSPMQAAELLEQFTSVRFTFIPNIEWFVEIDARNWIHFSRPYTQPRLQA
jgi:hypothetical protein